MTYEVSGDPSIRTEEGYGNIDLEVEKDVKVPADAPLDEPAGVPDEPARETGDPSIRTEEGYGDINMEYK